MQPEPVCIQALDLCCDSAIVDQSGDLVVGCYEYSNGQRTGSLVKFDGASPTKRKSVTRANFGILDLALLKNEHLISANSNNSIGLCSDSRIEEISLGAKDAVVLAVESAGGKILASKSDGSIACLSSNMDVEQTLKAHSMEAWSCSFLDESGKIAASGSDDCTLKLWDATNCFENIATISHHRAGVTCIERVPGSSWHFASGSYDNSLSTWDLRSLASPIQTRRCTGGVWRISWSRTNLMAVACMYGGCQLIYDDEAVSFDAPNPGISYGLVWSSESTLVTCSFYDKTVKEWKVV